MRACVSWFVCASSHPITNPMAITRAEGAAEQVMTCGGIDVLAVLLQHKDPDVLHGVALALGNCCYDGTALVTTAPACGCLPVVSDLDSG